MATMEPYLDSIYSFLRSRLRQTSSFPSQLLPAEEEPAYRVEVETTDSESLDDEQGVVSTNFKDQMAGIGGEGMPNSEITKGEALMPVALQKVLRDPTRAWTAIGVDREERSEHDYQHEVQTKKDEEIIEPRPDKEESSERMSEPTIREFPKALPLSFKDMIRRKAIRSGGTPPNRPKSAVPAQALADSGEKTSSDVSKNSRGDLRSSVDSALLSSVQESTDSQDEVPKSEAPESNLSLSSQGRSAGEAEDRKIGPKERQDWEAREMSNEFTEGGTEETKGADQKPVTFTGLYLRSAFQQAFSLPSPSEATPVKRTKLGMTFFHFKV